jgi:integrase
MRRQSNRLTVTGIKAALRRAPQEGKLMLPDGNGLYLQIKNTVPNWVYRFALNGRTGMMGLGALDIKNIDLAAARERAEDARRLKRRGIDPLAHRRTERQTQQINNARAVPSFAECAQRYIAAHRAEWRSAKHASHWSASLARDVFPLLGKLPVNAIDTGLILRVLEPVWQAKPVTASRVRSRIENVIDWAKAAGYRDGENPARWKGHLQNLLASPGKVHERQHHAALPHAEIAAFLAELRQHDGVAASALEFLILVAGRTDEVLGARWDEIDLDERLWVIPGPRMKGGKEHRVPLSSAAMAIIERMLATRDGDDPLIFPGAAAGRPLGHHSLRRMLEALGRTDITPHGFRSTFRDWVAEKTNFPSEIAEMALAHRVGDATLRAYKRTDLDEKRRQLAEAWSRYCTEPRGQVIPLGARAT